ncbi:MAG: Do family serine endopeptidase [Neisseria sp.]|nr:Do family serine endopeptidase [Neisseria sp.]
MKKSPFIALTLTVPLWLAACSDEQSEPAASAVVAKTENSPASTSSQLLPDFSTLVEKEAQAVVSIQAFGANNAENETLGFGSENFDFSGENDNFGTGFLISADGFIITNTHVIEEMETIKVTLHDKREYRAKLIGSDKKTDISVLKIDATDLPAVKIGNPQDLKVGEWVAAIGAPYGFDSSVTAGIVSAKGRSLPNETYTPFIQTDVAINPGNSGGPLFNLNGQVIGVNSQIYSRTGGSVGISFAIPINIAMNVAEQLRTTGKVERGQLGVQIQEVSYDLAQSFGLDKPNGALISQVFPNSPGEEAGLQVGDIIRSVNGQEVRSSTELPSLIGSIAPGKEVVLGVWRNGEQKDIKAQLNVLNEGTANPASNSEPSSSQSESSPAFSVGNTGLFLAASHVNGTARLLVVKAEQQAARIGLRAGDSIEAVNMQAVSDEASFKQAWDKSPASVSLLVQRRGNTIFLVLNK